MENHLILAIQAAIKAGKEILSIYNSDNFDIELKDDNSPLTQADLRSHNVISSILKQTNFPILSEEGSVIPYDIRKKWQKLWIIDPIDGTKEFIKRNGEFTINIALIENTVPIIGVVYVPVSGELYFSTINLGSYKIFLKSKNFNFKEILDLSFKLPIKKKRTIFTIVASRSHLSKETSEFIDKMKEEHGEIKLISKGSSLKLCLVAEGIADCYPRYAPTMEWDTAAGQAICNHAGFDVIDYVTKKNIVYNRKKLLNNWFTVK